MIPSQYLVGKTVLHVDCKTFPCELNGENKQLISRIDLYLGEQILVLEAKEECCDLCWFEVQRPLEDLVGQILKEIVLLDPHVDLPLSGFKEVDYNRIVKVKLAEGDFTFIMRDSSNGYYSGYFSMILEQNTLKKEYLA